MTKYKKILAAVDFSEYSDVVLQAALQQAECSGAALVALHVVDYSWPIDNDYLIPPGNEREEALLNSAAGRLQETLMRLAARDVRPLVVSGPPRQEILRVAEQEAADLIVIGAHGHHGIAGLLGSTSDRVLHQASCHVLTVR